MKQNKQIRACCAVAATLAVLATLPGCGDGSQPQQAAAAPRALAGAAAPAQQTIRAAVAQLNVEVTPRDVSSGHAARLELRVSLPDAVRRVVALAGNGYEQATPLALTQQDAGVWSIVWPSAGGLLLRFELDNGEMLESAPGEFTFN